MSGTAAGILAEQPSADPMGGHPHPSNLGKRRAYAAPDAMPEWVYAVGTVSLRDVVHVTLDGVHGPRRMPRADVVRGVVHIDKQRGISEFLQGVSRFHVWATDPCELDGEVQAQNLGQEVPGKTRDLSQSAGTSKDESLSRGQRANSHESTGGASSTMAARSLR